MKVLKLNTPFEISAVPRIALVSSDVLIFTARNEVTGLTQTLKKVRSELHHAIFLVAAKAVQNHNGWSLFMRFQVFGQLQHACKIQAVRWEIDIAVHD